ncbi:MAG: sigma-70 family RNA polymerase sigma factor [Planctomycetes bacterium]|nr:sigma-70 family RNA polymerase sigma factor [Planctomycetota bacterium]
MPDDERHRDRDWIRSVVLQYEGPLTIYVARMLGDDDRARDVVQDAFLRLWQAERASVDGHVAKWLYRVCRNRAVDVCRKEHRMTTLDARKMDANAAPERPPRHGNPAETTEHHGGVLALVASLPERQQEVVRLKFQGGLSYREMAEVMNTTVNNVGVLLHTAIKSIRTRMAELAGDGDGETTETQQQTGVAR